MTRNLIVVLIMLIAFSASSQNKKKKRATGANDCYLEAAVATFDLSEEDKEKLNTLFINRLEERASIRQKAKSSKITKEEAKAQSKAMNQKYFNNVADLIGKPKKEIMAFEKETKTKCR